MCLLRNKVTCVLRDYEGFGGKWLMWSLLACFEDVTGYITDII